MRIIQPDSRVSTLSVEEILALLGTVLVCMKVVRGRCMYALLSSANDTRVMAFNFLNI